MSEQNEVAGTLRAAADLIEPPGRWIQETYAKTETGRDVNPNHPDAVCWCASGAIMRTACSPESYVAAMSTLEAVTGELVVKWNDVPGRTTYEVVSALRSAADKADSS